jgi:hypothetical protein
MFFKIFLESNISGPEQEQLPAEFTHVAMPPALHPDLDVRQGKLLRQRHGGDVLQDPEIRARLAEPSFTLAKKPTRPLAATSTGSTIPSGAIPLSTSQTRRCSKKRSPNDPMPLY